MMMKKMFRVVLIGLLCLTMVAGLAACGGVDKKPLKESYNKAAAAFNELAELVNANSEYIDSSMIDTFKEMSDLLLQYKEKAENDEELTQEQMDKMINWLDNDLTNYCKTTKEELQAALDSLAAEG